MSCYDSEGVLCVSCLRFRGALKSVLRFRFGLMS